MLGERVARAVQRGAGLLDALPDDAGLSPCLIQLRMGLRVTRFGFLDSRHRHAVVRPGLLEGRSRDQLFLMERLRPLEILLGTFQLCLDTRQRCLSGPNVGLHGADSGLGALQVSFRRGQLSFLRADVRRRLDGFQLRQQLPFAHPIAFPDVDRGDAPEGAGRDVYVVPRPDLAGRRDHSHYIEPFGRHGLDRWNPAPVPIEAARSRKRRCGKEQDEVEQPVLVFSHVRWMRGKRGAPYGEHGTPGPSQTNPFRSPSIAREIIASAWNRPPTRGRRPSSVAGEVRFSGHPILRRGTYRRNHGRGGEVRGWILSLCFGNPHQARRGSDKATSWRSKVMAPFSRSALTEIVSPAWTSPSSSFRASGS